MVLDATIADSKTRQKYAKYESDFTPPAHGIRQFFDNDRAFMRFTCSFTSSNVVAFERICVSDFC